MIGLGNADRGDDAVGLRVAERVRELAPAGVDVAVTEDPLGMLDLWQGHEVVVVVDAVASGAEPGRLHAVEAGTTHPPLPGDAWAGDPRGGSHALGLATAVELGRSLGRLPARLMVLGVEAGGFEHGEPLSPPVEAAVPEAAARVIEEVAGRVPR